VALAERCISARFRSAVACAVAPVPVEDDVLGAASLETLTPVPRAVWALAGFACNKVAANTAVLALAHSSARLLMTLTIERLL